MNKQMVVGLLFCEQDVLMVRKTHPDWQVGCWNGIGGGIEDGESEIEAMIREFREETSILDDLNWRAFAEEQGPGYAVYFYAARVPEHSKIAEKNDEGEPLAWRFVPWLHQFKVVGNLRWLVPLALDWRENTYATVHTMDDIRERAAW